jgi:general secretion pathway protein B
MSYILDALRKSEEERRQSESLVLTQGPAHPIELPRRRLATWAGAAVVTVVIIAAATYWAVAGRQSDRIAPTSPAPNQATVPMSEAAPAASSAAVPTAGEALPLATEARPAPELKPHPLVPLKESEGARDLADEAQVVPRKPKRARRAAPPMQTAGESPANGVASAPGPQAIKFLRAMSPDFQRSLPELVVNIHIYAPRAADRILYINNHQYHAGDRVRDDIRVEEIVEDGAVMSSRGQRFKLPRPS